MRPQKNKKGGGDLELYELCLGLQLGQLVSMMLFLPPQVTRHVETTIVHLNRKNLIVQSTLVNFDPPYSPPSSTIASSVARRTGLELFAYLSDLLASQSLILHLSNHFKCLHCWFFPSIPNTIALKSTNSPMTIA